MTPKYDNSGDSFIGDSIANVEIGKLNDILQILLVMYICVCVCVCVCVVFSC